MKTLKIDDSILKHISGGRSVSSDDPELAREIDPMIRDYKYQTSGATPEELREAGLDEGYKGLLMYLDQKCADGSIAIMYEALPAIRDYITRNYDRVN